MVLFHEGMFALSEIKQAAPELIVGYTHTHTPQTRCGFVKMSETQRQWVKKSVEALLDKWVISVAMIKADLFGTFGDHLILHSFTLLHVVFTFHFPNRASLRIM